MKETNLFLHEEVLLLALKDKKGTIYSALNYHFILAGAILAELFLKGRIEIEKERKKSYIRLVNSKLVADPVIDDCIAKLKKAKRRQQAVTWISRFSGVKNMKNRIAKQLCRKGILKAEEDKVLLIFKRKLYPEINHKPEKEIMARLTKAIFTDTNELDTRTILLVAIGSKSNLLKTLFDNKELKHRKKRIEQICSGDVIGKATSEAIQAMQAAIIAACVVPVVVTGGAS